MERYTIRLLQEMKHVTALVAPEALERAGLRKNIE